jgi:iron(III) transport system permease protein
MTTQILASKLNGEVAAAQAETVVLAAVALAGLAAMRRAERRLDAASGGRGLAPERRALRGRAARLAAAAGGWGLALFLLLPHLTLLLVSFVPTGTWTVEFLPPVLSLANFRVLLAEPERLRPLVNSLWMAAAATAGALVLGFVAARRARAERGALRGALESLVALPWSIPGTVFAVALATTMSVDRPWLGRLLLVGTAWILPLAYLVRSLPLTGRSAIAGLAQLDPALEEAAAALGAGPWRRLRRVVLPLVRPALAAGAGIAFITALGDFVVSIVLYTYETRPISIEILSSLRLQELGLAAAYGVVLMLLSAAAYLLWNDRGATA